MISIKKQLNQEPKQERILKKIRITIKILLIAATAIYPVFMNVLAGAGLIINSDSYGTEFIFYGVFLILSSVIMLTAVIMCIIKMNISSIAVFTAGFIPCMIVLFKIVRAADIGGWSTSAMQPASKIYINRILPTILPYILLIVLAALQYFSYDAAVKRRIKKEKREKDKNRSAPKILDD